MAANETPELKTKSMRMRCHGHYVDNRDISLVSDHKDMPNEAIHSLDSQAFGKKEVF